MTEGEHPFHEATRLRPIGVIRTDFEQRAGMPIQGTLAPETEGRVEVHERWAEGLLDVEQFTHLYLLYLFHRAEPCRSLRAKPFMDDVEHGVFAIRSPVRPNPVGLSVVRLLRREGRVLHVRGVDMLDGTPLLDIKPYFPRIDAHPEASSGWAEEGLRDPDRHRADDRFGG